VHAVPERNPDITSDIMTRPNAALLYRLSGDYNPLHADPAVAHAAGFEKPILHGLCSFGLACRSLVTSVCDGDPRLLRSMRARFSAPVYPGETITTDIWLNGSESISFRARVAQRNVVVINGGHATLAAE
jgi:acyl dehydratase